MPASKLCAANSWHFKQQQVFEEKNEIKLWSPRCDGGDKETGGNNINMYIHIYTCICKYMYVYTYIYI